MGSPMKIRASLSGETADVKVLMRHDMETGQRKDASGAVIPAWYIQEVTVALNGKAVVTAEWGAAVSKDPYLALKVKGAKSGDAVSVTWVDNKGDTRTDETKIA
ncbi:MAG: thiosulfate oxidation carrier complex protein SoxZ [Rhodocyclaceae bacterium]|nr:thiosulfate oxidation carrier complex protein SoxZ [Rhodocyclaceae bacterium]MBX3670229.1 thiosulfate oxidation carrier complex protein SoxZ [Rhodocyclaceae bacterium]